MRDSSSDDIMPAMDRWHPNGVQYRAPGIGAGSVCRAGRESSENPCWDRMSQREQATRSISSTRSRIKARFRGAQKTTYRTRRNEQCCGLTGSSAQTFPVIGSSSCRPIGDTRTYNAYNEGLANIDAIPEVQDREIGFAITVESGGRNSISHERPHSRRRGRRRLILSI